MLATAELNQFLASHEFTRRPGFRVVGTGDGECDLMVPYQPEHDRPDGIVAGYVYMRAADIAFWLAIKTRIGLDAEFVTSSMTTQFLSPARSAPFVCSARLIKQGRRLIYGEAECVAGDRTLSHHVLAFIPVVPAERVAGSVPI